MSAALYNYSFFKEGTIFSWILFDDIDKITVWVDKVQINKNVTNIFGFTPLNYALWKRNQKAALIFIENNMYIHIPILEDLSPLHLAAKTSNHSAMILLIERGADINFLNNELETPLDHIFNESNQDYHVYKILLEYGASCRSIENILHRRKDPSFRRIVKILLHYLKFQKFINSKKSLIILKSRIMLKFYETFQHSFQ